MKTKLANLLVKHGIVQSVAIEDPEGYDKGATLEGIANVAEELNKLTPEESALVEAVDRNGAGIHVFRASHALADKLKGRK